MWDDKNKCDLIKTIDDFHHGSAMCVARAKENNKHVHWKQRQIALGLGHLSCYEHVQRLQVFQSCTCGDTLHTFHRKTRESKKKKKNNENTWKYLNKTSNNETVEFIMSIKFYTWFRYYGIQKLTRALVTFWETTLLSVFYTAYKSFRTHILLSLMCPENSFRQINDWIYTFHRKKKKKKKKNRNRNNELNDQTNDNSLMTSTRNSKYLAEEI